MPKVAILHHYITINIIIIIITIIYYYYHIYIYDNLIPNIIPVISIIIVILIFTIILLLVIVFHVLLFEHTQKNLGIYHVVSLLPPPSFVLPCHTSIHLLPTPSPILINGHPQKAINTCLAF